MQKTPEDLQKIKAFLETSPDLNAYDYQEWDQSTDDFVKGVIANTVPGGRIAASIDESNRTAAPQRVSSITDEPVVTPAKSESALPKITSDTDELNLDGFNDSSFDDELYASL
jgi:hypothetical protein